MVDLRPRPPRAAIRSVEVGTDVQPLSGLGGCDCVRVFVTQRGRPIGFTDLSVEGASVGAERLREAIMRQLGERIAAAAAVVPSPALPPEVPASVVVATYDRPAELARCLRALRAQETRRPLDVVVVDNHPASGLTPPVLADFPGVTLVAEPRRGAAYARNAGFVAARGAVLACTDDDVSVPPGWLEALLPPFADERVMAVTGNILPLELDTPAQWFVEMYGGLGRGFERRVFDRAWFEDSGGPAPTWSIGGTANAAFRARALADPSIGLMDEALGPGMPSGVGEDSYLFYRILKAGHRIVYEPDAWVWHRHRRDMRALRRQMYAYAKGHVAHLLTTWLRDGDRRALSRLGIRLPRWHVKQLERWAVARVRGEVPYPLSLMLVELAGHLAGPVGLWRSWRRVRREGRSAPYVLAATPS
jgi:glycosyltransferase involved in cell wall biosynthesis